MAADSGQSRASAWLWLAALLWAGYAVPLFVPPPTVHCGMMVPADAGLLERLFPDVPAWWIALRLACLFGAAVVFAWATRDLVPDRSAGEPPPGRVSRATRCALLISAALLVAGFWAAHFSRWQQWLYIVGLTLPSLLLFAAERPFRPRGWVRTASWIGVIPAAWVVLRLPNAWHAPRIASAVDTLGVFTYLERVAPAGFNLLTDRPFPGVSALFFILQGAGWLGSDALPLTLPALQIVNVVWMAVIAAGVATLSARLVNPVTAPIAAAAFLFAPFALLAPLGPIALFHAALVTVGLLLLLCAIHATRSPAAIAAFGVLAGIGATHPLTLPITLLFGAAACWLAWRRPRLPAPLALLGLLSFAAVVLPGAPSGEELLSMRDTYSFGQRAWRPLEYILLGQRSPLERAALLDAIRTAPADIPLGALLSPFAIPRTPIRLWGDVLYDPIGIGLAAGAIAACIGAVRRSGLARGLLVLLAIGLLPAVVSSTDRPSLTRTAVAHTVLPLFAALGFELARRRIGWLRPRATALAVAAAIAVSGIVLFDRINPRILPASASALALEALEQPPSTSAVILDHDEVEFGFLQVAGAARRIPAEPVSVVAYTGAGTLQQLGGSEPLVFWSPGLEERYRVTDAACQRWPHARVFTIADRSGCARVFAAALADWQPALPAERWSVRPCDG